MKNERIAQTKNMHDFVKYHEKLSNDDLRTIYHTISTLANDYDDLKQHDVSEYFRQQSDAIASMLLFIRFNDDITEYLRFIDTKK